MIMMDKWAYSSALRDWNPYSKLLFGIANLLLCIICRSYLVSVVVFIGMLLCIVNMSGMPLKAYSKLLLVPLIFLIISTITIVFEFGNVEPARVVISLAGGYIHATASSIEKGFSLFLSSFAAISCLYFIAVTTPVIDIIQVLRSIHCPKILIELMFLIYRFIFLLFETGNAITVAQDCRLGHKDAKTSMVSTSKMAAVLLVRAYQKADALFNSMEARGYDGDICVLSTISKPRRSELFWVLAVIGVEVILVCVFILL